MAPSFSDALEPGQWTVASWEEQLAVAQLTHRQIFRNDGEVSPLSLYLYLRGRFGVPNGTEMHSRAPDSLNPVQWSYGLKLAAGFRLGIKCLNDGIEAWLSGPQEIPDSGWKDLVRIIRTDMPNHGHKMQAVRRTLEAWSLAINPFRRVDIVLEDVEERLAASPQPPTPPALQRKTTKAEMDAFMAAHRAHLAATRSTYVDSSLARMLSPILAESFLNLVLFALAKPNIRADRELVRELTRRDIDERVRTLHQDCFGFSKPVDMSDNRVKDFLRATNERNDLLHGNIDPSRLAYDTVWFDFNTVPLFKDDVRLTNRLVGYLVAESSPSRGLQAIRVARDFVALILDSLNPLERALMTDLLSMPHVGWRAETTSVGRMFGDAVPELHIADGTIALTMVDVDF